jgi:hypothetical protein
MRSTHEEMERHLPCLLHMQLLRLHARAPHAGGACMHADVRPMPADAHAGGDHERPLRLPCKGDYCAHGERLCMRPLSTPANVAT